MALGLRSSMLDVSQVLGAGPFHCYYKVGHEITTKCDRYYKVRRVLQRVTVITKWEVTKFLKKKIFETKLKGFLCLLEEEALPWKVQRIPALYNKRELLIVF